MTLRARRRSLRAGRNAPQRSLMTSPGSSVNIEQGAPNMRGILLPGDRRVQVSEFPDPTPGEGEVVVQMRAAAVCGSDLHTYRTPAERRGAGAGTIPGHEPAG